MLLGGNAFDDPLTDICCLDAVTYGHSTGKAHIVYSDQEKRGLA